VSRAHRKLNVGDTTAAFELGPDVNYYTINVPLNYHADVSKSSLVPVGLIIQTNKISVMAE
jgi:hypothetical protein